ncbi:hypothetical protein [Streptomyces sp. NBC_01235]|uniref:hypothetical protein n=1 Tax=Streptomyces sp. NBC_01235 TaxID=2903788 RepID=UPI002E0DDB8A|nr:hypothetical protein OG289_19735 [Streptomyces sp. NBC_01235]
MTTITSAETAVEYARENGWSTETVLTTFGQVTVKIVKCVKGLKTVSGVWATAPDLQLPWHTYWCKGFYSSGSGSDRMIDDMTSKDPKVAALENVLAELV